MIFAQLGHPPTNGGVAGLDAWLVSTARPHLAPYASEWIPDWDGARFAASIVYDTANSALPTGVRAFIQAGTRRLLFAAGDYEVLFRIGPSGSLDTFTVVGQVLYEGLPVEAASVRLADVDDTYETDQTGGFRVSALAAGMRTFEVATKDGVIEIAPISVSAAC